MKRGLRARFFAALLPALSQGHARVSEPWRRKLLGGLAGTVLEIGPGTGINLAYLPDRVYWLGLEPNPHLHPWLETALRQRGVLGEVLLGQAEEIPLPQESVDAVVATLVLCSVEDPRRALAEILREKRGCGGAIIPRFSNRGYMDSPTSTTGGHGFGTVFLGAKFPVDLETWSRGFHRVVRWVKLQTNTRGRARSIALACRYGVKVFLGPDGAFGSNPEKPRTLVRGVVTVLRPGGRFVFLEHVAAPQGTLRVTGVPAFAGPRISSVPLGPFWGMVAIPTGKPWPLFGRQGLPGWKRRPLRVAAGKAHPFKGGMKGAPGCPSFRPLMLAVKCT
ncbi:class I SAM-dependent methyltransferase [Thermus scotoductus]|uniref:class I SAM-dependent methyltransferase n=1 Tax=Thermus scotoductus TaxID=37636 RepID=UPI0026CF8A9F